MLDFRMAGPGDYDILCELYKSAIEDMRSHNIFQWDWGVYPARDIILSDIENKWLYMLYEGENLIGAFALNERQAPEYKNLEWYYGINVIVMHRLCILPAWQGRGMGRRAMEVVISIAKTLGHDALRLDTYTLNPKAMALYENLGMEKVGYVNFEFREAKFCCFEMPLIDDCYLLPMKMHPAFRHGKDTPWGGHALRDLFDKAIPDERTGESLEISVIKNLCSYDDRGAGLDELLIKFGEKLAGTGIKGPFPLLLKLIDAREDLSVQVHPNDMYAAEFEGGKLGKTEAWLILHTEPGAKLVYGIKKGVTREALEQAAKNGREVEALLRYIEVKPGDVCYIPAGCVHAIGAGIVLYEIQQSSDVTYRFYDYDRMDAAGNKRELHLKKALDVTDLDFELSPISIGDLTQSAIEQSQIINLLANPIFELKEIKVKDEYGMQGDKRRFSFITALDEMELSWQGGALLLKKGDSVMLPAASPDINFTGTGRLILAQPTLQ